jgi:hypothetical protein
MRRGLLILALLVASCSSGQATATPSATPPSAGCRLPLWLYDRATNIGTARFLQLPGSVLVLAQPPVASNHVVATYLPRAKRWLQVARSLIAPDGSYYAYSETSGNPAVDRVHVVDVATGADRVIAQGNGSTGYNVFDVEADGIYAGSAANGPATLPGLWRIDARTGAATKIDATQRWQWISGGYAFAAVPNSADPVVVQGGTVPDTLMRLDLRTGAVQELLRKRGVFPRVIGFDGQGRPLVVLGETLNLLVVVIGLGTVQTVPGGTPDVSFAQATSTLVASSDRFWFTADQGVFSYSPKAGFQKLWSNPSSNGIFVEVAGPCS